MVPESDPNVNLINDSITREKDEVDKVSKQRSLIFDELKEIQERRADVFLRFYDEVVSSIQYVYKRLTMKDQNFNMGGQIEIFLDDRQNPFDKSIHIYPSPPGKRVVYDVSALSGGEKTVAALSLLFALVQVKMPPLILLDEVDAFLDSQNVALVTDFIRDELKT